MTSSNMNISTVSCHCMQGDFSVNVNAPTSQLDRKATFGHTSSYELNHSESSNSELRPEWLHSKDASKRKRVNRTAKLKQCKLDARREQWLSQVPFAGSHSRTKHEDECHNNLACKVSDGRSTGLLSEQGSPSGSECELRTQKTAFQVPHSVEGRDMGPSTAASMSTDGFKQARPLRWDALNQSELTVENYTKQKYDEQAFKSILKQHDDNGMIEVQSANLMHKCSLTDSMDMSCIDMDPSPATGTQDSRTLVIVMGTGVIQAEGSLCRVEEFVRDERGRLASNTLKQEQGSGNFDLSGSDVCPTQSTTSYSSSSGYGGSSSDDNIGNSHSHDLEDDWEAVADAIFVKGSISKMADPLKMGILQEADLLEKHGKLSTTPEFQSGALKPEYRYKTGVLGGRTRAIAGRAWRPDDAGRPPTLPRLSKQQSFPLLTSTPAWSGLRGNNLWDPPPAPLFCPICTEELDVTDSSFVPCSCGFRLCLFCHHRIASDDGRCPGCRKTYSSDVAGKLSNTASVWVQI